MVDDQLLLDIDTKSESHDDWNRNIMVKFNDVYPSKCNKKVNIKPNRVFFHKHDLNKAELHYKQQQLQSVEHDAIVMSKINSMFQTPCYQSYELRSIIRCATTKTITEVLLAIYTTYHSPISILLFSLFEHEDMVILIKLFQCMTPLMN
jgi:hypothetical protein